MNVYQLSEPGRLGSRSHPWDGSAADPRHRYRDFVESPELIRSSLEDLIPFASYPAIETFYQLLEQINGPDSDLMTNDCAFTGPGPNTSLQSRRKQEASGRVMVLFRDLERNTLDHVGELANRLALALAPMEPGFEDGILAASLVDVNFTAFEPARAGSQLLISFWGWGDGPYATMFAMDRTLKCLSQAIRSL